MGRTRSVTGNLRTALDSGWQMAAAPAGSTFEQRDEWSWLAAHVPGTAASALRAAGAWSWDESRLFDAEDWWWRLRFNADAGAATLGLDGIATLADVWLDGVHLLASDNMFVAHALPVVLSGEHELVIRCRSLTDELARKRPRPRWRVPMLESQQLRWLRTTLLGRTPGWSPPCPPVGPWRGVWIERTALHVDDVRLASRVDAATGAGIVEVTAGLGDDVAKARLVVARGNDRASGELTFANGRWQGTASVATPTLWWPHTHGEPACYQLSIEVTRRGDPQPDPIVVDLGWSGFRTLAIDRDDGDFALRVNGVRVFCRGACWTPLDVVSLSATPQAYRTAIEQARDAGMNMLRVAGTMVYEDDAFLDALDACGVLLWQDLMFANMDYPEDDAFIAGAVCEVDQQLSRLQARPCLAVICGNSEAGQQAAMSGAARERWAAPLFHEVFAARAAEIGAEYVPSSAHGGAFPHAADVGVSSYYGVGAYLRPIDDARRAHVRFASECLAFANIPDTSGLARAAASRVHQPEWKQRAPRDLGAGWDFDDVRDHYVQQLYGVDPTRLRTCDHERYLALGRAATGEVMARVFAEWRRARSITRGGLVWFLRDLWPGAGWGLVDANGTPKACFHALRRVLAPRAISMTDEGVNGLAIHVVNDRAQSLDARIEVTLWRAGDIRTGHGSAGIVVPGRGAVELPASTLFDGFLDLSFAYRFGPPVADVVHAVLFDGNAMLADTFWFPAGLGAHREHDIGLHASVGPGNAAGEYSLVVGSARFAQSVTIEVDRYSIDDNGFHLAPGQARTLALRPSDAQRRPIHGTVTALNAEHGARFTLP